MRHPALSVALTLVFLPLASAAGETLLVYPELEPQIVYRVDTETGDAQVLSQTKGIFRWVKINETERIRSSAYRFIAIVENGGTRLVRFDSVSGASWITQGGSWKKVIEP